MQKLNLLKEKKITKKEKRGKSSERNKIKRFNTMSELSLFMWGLKQQSNEENKLEWKFEKNYSASKIVKTPCTNEKTTCKTAFQKSSVNNSVSLNIWRFRKISIVYERSNFCSGWACW